MLHWTWKSIVSAGLLVATTTGCSSLPTTTVRGQSPDQAQLLIHEEAGWKPTGTEIQPVNGVQRADTRLNGELQGLVRNNLNEFDVSRHGYRTPVSPDAYGQMMTPVASGGASPYARWGSFDQYPAPNGPYAGFNQCPPYHQEECWDHGGMRQKGQYHYHTYRYKAPNCLVYPAPQQPAGVVTYPYYTHKGPSDFFMK